MQYTIALRPDATAATVPMEFTINADDVTVESFDDSGSNDFTYYKFTQHDDTVALMSVKDVLYIRRS